MALDERLRRELERAGRPADPTGVYEHLIRRRERRRIARRVEIGVLTVVVVAGSTGAVVALSRVFEPREPSPVIAPRPVPISPHANGRLAYARESPGGMALHSVLPDGSGDELIPTPPGLPWLPAWSPDGARIAVAIFPTGGGDRAIWVMNADGSDPREIASSENVSVPSWSPDGSTIAYTALAGGRTQVHLVASDGTSDRVVHAESAEGTFAIFSAQFSPDGRRLLFDRGTDSGFDIFVMDVDGTNVRQLTTSGSDYDPHWSPDGSQIAFTRQGVGAQSDVYVMTSDGSNVRQLTDGGDGITNLHPQWSPDGTKIAYLEGVTGGPGALVVMDADGSDPATIIQRGVLGISWQPLPASSTSPSPNESPAPTGSASPGSEQQDIGLGFPVCDVTSVSGEFSLGVAGTAYVATKMGDTGSCPDGDGGFHVVAVDVTGDGVADASYGPVECDWFCSAFAAPDVDGDGTDELLVQNIQFSIAGVRLYEVRTDPAEVFQVTVSTPGYPEGGLPPGAEPQLFVGGDGFQVDSLRCMDTGEGRVLIQTSASQVPPDTLDSVWQATATWFALGPDGTVAVVDTETFEEPFDPDGPSFTQGDGVCGARIANPMFRSG